MGSIKPTEYIRNFPVPRTLILKSGTCGCVGQGQDRIDYLERKGVVYKIPCSSCDAVYCGQTEKSVSTRIQEHQLAVKRRDHLSQVATHTLDTGHKFAWENTRIIGACPIRKRREFLEAMHSDEACINGISIQMPHTKSLRTDSN